MEKITQRAKYSQNFHEFWKKVKLNDTFMKGLKKHRYFRDDMKTVKKFRDEDSKKVYILLEFTRERSTCDEIIKLLELSGQDVVANELKRYNTSPGCMEITYDDVIKVTPGKEKKGSLPYEMSQNPRGKCIIINNFVEFLNGTKDIDKNLGLYKESIRFESIFKQLYFDVEPIHMTVNMTANMIRDKLKLIFKDLVKCQAFVVMIISHGRDEKVLGIDYCNKKDKNDLIEISDIVDVFSDKNCKILRNTPKLFFFNCCRTEYETHSVKRQKISSTQDSSDVGSMSGISVNNLEEEFREIPILETVKKQWIDENKDTFIVYSCSKGFKAKKNNNLGFSNFGQALSHSIAQYACEESLQSILSRTCDFIDKHYKNNSKSAPEIHGQGLRRELHFNPGTP